MIMRPNIKDIKLISFFTGKIIIGLGLIMTIPMVTAILFQEWSPLIDFFIGIGITLCIGYLMVIWGAIDQIPNWIHGMVAASFSWFVAMGVVAIPYWLSGHYLSYLDAMFDVMSGFTTTGLVLAQDMDHFSDSLNMWRLVVTFIGGQGMIVLALTFLVKSAGGGYKLYVGEAKDERLVPSVAHTAKEIWKISLVYLATGTFVLWVVGLIIGLNPVRAFLHALWMFMSSWSTGGFAPMSQNMLYYHSFLYEIVTVIIFVIGSFNFALHYAVWTRNKREIFRNIEVISFTTTVIILTLIGCYGLMKLNVYPSAVNLFRKGFYQIISGHTTTGLMTVYARQFILEWGDLALIAIIISMLFGGSACSTAGGFKGLRISIIFKAILQDVKRLLNPELAIVMQRFHYLKPQILEEKQVRSAALIIIMYIATFVLTTIVGSFYGYPLLEAAFEAASVTGNVGLSIGVTSASMPVILKIVYILTMWIGRLEFMSVLVLVGFIAAGVRRR